MNEMLNRALKLANGYALPGVLYRDPDIYEQEIRAIFMKAWLYVGHQSQIPQRATISCSRWRASRSSSCATAKATSTRC